MYEDKELFVLRLAIKPYVLNIASQNNDDQQLNLMTSLLAYDTQFECI